MAQSRCWMAKVSKVWQGQKVHLPTSHQGLTSIHQVLKNQIKDPLLFLKSYYYLNREMLGKSDGMFQCFACMKCNAFGNEGYYDDVQIIDQSQVGTPYSLKLMAATAAIRHELRAGMDNFPTTLKSYVDSLDPEKRGKGSFTLRDETM